MIEVGMGDDDPAHVLGVKAPLREGREQLRASVRRLGLDERALVPGHAQIRRRELPRPGVAVDRDALMARRWDLLTGHRVAQGA